MKQQSVYDLWTIKRMVQSYSNMAKCSTAIIERINKVLLEENGVEAVLYSPNDEIELLRVAHMEYGRVLNERELP